MRNGITVYAIYFVGIKFRDFRVLEKIIHRKQKIYMVHTLFLTDSQNFNPTKYMAYTVFIIINNFIFTRDRFVQKFMKWKIHENEY